MNPRVLKAELHPPKNRGFGKPPSLQKPRFAMPDRIANGTSTQRHYVPPHQQVRETGNEQIKSYGNRT
jgi:hypothetical protein